MAVKKAKKVEILTNLKEIISKKSSLVMVNFHGLNVADTTEMRKGLRDNKVGYLVAKKTLVKKALALGKVGGELPELDGEIALVYGDDQLAPAREVYNFQKKFKDHLQILGGVFEGKFLGKEDMISIASIPPLQVLHGQFVNLINSPIQGLVIALNAVAKQKQ